MDARSRLLALLADNRKTHWWTRALSSSARSTLVNKAIVNYELHEIFLPARESAPQSCSLVHLPFVKRQVTFFTRRSLNTNSSYHLASNHRGYPAGYGGSSEL